MTLIPLNRHQRELISIFVRYLRSLREFPKEPPKDWSHLDGEHGKMTLGEYQIVMRLLSWRFCGHYGQPTPLDTETRERWIELLTHAASTDPIVLWRRKNQEVEKSVAAMEHARNELLLITANHEELVKAVGECERKLPKRRKMLWKMQPAGH